jgi:hypothetical protein
MREKHYVGQRKLALFDRTRCPADPLSVRERDHFLHEHPHLEITSLRFHCYGDTNEKISITSALNSEQHIKFRVTLFVQASSTWWIS